MEAPAEGVRTSQSDPVLVHGNVNFTTTIWLTYHVARVYVLCLQFQLLDVRDHHCSSRTNASTPYCAVYADVSSLTTMVSELPWTFYLAHKEERVM